MTTEQCSIEIDCQYLKCGNPPIYKIGEHGVLAYVDEVEEVGAIVGVYWNKSEWKYMFRPDSMASTTLTIPLSENQISPF